MNIPNHFPLPPDLPVPQDDGAANHLPDLAMPQLSLPSTSGGSVELGHLGAGRTVIFCYPMTGVPGQPLPAGWDLIPGARGCTPQACGFRDLHAEFSQLGARIFGLSTQTTEYQQELALRVHLPFPILSDAGFKFTAALNLPTFEANGQRLLKRITLVIQSGRIEQVFYPVFPPNESAQQVLNWLRNQTGEKPQDT